METFEFIKTLLWIMVQPMIAWAIMDLINVPRYIKLCKQIRKEQQEQEMVEIAMAVADDFHRSIGK